MKYFLILLVVLALAAGIVRLSFYTVDPTEYVYVTQFGQHLATFDGSDADNDAGFHWCWPWPVTSVQRLDRRLQYVDLPSFEVVTHDPKGGQEHRLLVEAYVCWQIAGKDTVDLFIRRFGTLPDAEAHIGQKINSHLSGLLQQKSIKDLIHTDPAIVAATMKQVHDDLIDKMKPRLRDEYGVQLVDVRLRRFSYAPKIRGDIFDRIKSERQKKATEFRSKGLKKAQDIRSQADQERERILADARKQETIIKGTAKVEAARIRNMAHSKDPEFYIFLKKLESLQSILGNEKTVLLLSSHREIFNMLFQPPQGSAVGKAQSTSTKNGNGKKTNGSPAGGN